MFFLFSSGEDNEDILESHELDFINNGELISDEDNSVSDDEDAEDNEIKDL
jgi:hypothetical protein